MGVKQISVFLENRKGRLLAVTECLGANGINMRALSLADTSDFGILRMIVNDPEAAITALKGCHFTVSSHEVIAVQVPDTPGGFNSVLKVMGKANVNVEYSYAFCQGDGAYALVVFRVDDQEAAEAALEEAGIKMLDGAEAY